MNEYKFSEIYLGLSSSFEVIITQTMIDSFLNISSDVNPLHTDDVYGKKQGFKGRVIHGFLSASFYSTLVGIYLPGKFALLQGIDAQFVSPAYLGDSLLISGNVTHINEAYRQIEIKASIINSSNKKISRAVIKVGLIDD